MHRLLPLAFLLLAFFATSLSAATEWFVAPAPVGNNNNPGTSALPFATIARASTAALAGDTVSIRAGTYVVTERFIPTRSGTSTAPISYRAVDGPVIFNGNHQVPSYLWDGIIDIRNRSHLVFDGLTVLNSRFFGIHVFESHYITIRNCSTDQTYGSGIRTVDSTWITLTGNSVRRACTLPLSLQPNGRINTQECISINATTDFDVGYNVVFDRLIEESGGGEGIDVKGTSARGKVHHNVVYDLYRLGIYVDAFDDDIHDIEIYNNTVFRCSSGIVLAYEDRITGSVRDIRIHDNLVYDISGVGFRIAGYLFNGPIKDVQFYNNTVANCAIGLYIEASDLRSGNFVIRNNIFSNNPEQVKIRQEVIDRGLLFSVDNNLFHNPPRSGVTVVPLPSQVTNSLLADPRFTDVAAKNFSLSPNSPAIDRALAPLLSSADYDGAPRPLDGNADGLSIADLGAFEFVSAFTQPTDGVVRAMFTDGVGASLPQQFPGSPGDGWSAGWTLSPAAIATVETTAPLDASTGPYLRVARTGGTAQEGVYRPWAAGVRPLDQPARLTFQLRLDSPVTTFNTAADTLTIASRAQPVTGAGADANFILRAFGAATANLAAREWGVFNGDPGVANAYDATRFLPTGVILTPGTTYTFTVDLYAAPATGVTEGRIHGTYDVTISGGGQTGKVAGLGFRSAATTLGGFLTFATEQGATTDALAFSLDSLELGPLAPAPLTARQLWINQHFTVAERNSPAAESTRWGDLADPDADGVVNLLEYAFAGDPLAPGSAGIQPALQVSGLSSQPFLTLTFLRAGADLTYIVQGSSDLVTWADLATNPGAVSTTVPVVFTDSVPLTEPAASRRFLRLKVTTP